MFDHLSLTVSNFKSSLAFYEAALAPLGYRSVKTTQHGKRLAGFGLGNALKFWIVEGSQSRSNAHFAFSAESHAAVDAFHHQALGSGGQDNGAPGIRSQYHASYYAAFLIDPDGNNIEVVCHFPGRLEDQFAAEELPVTDLPP